MDGLPDLAIYSQPLGIAVIIIVGFTFGRLVSYLKMPMVVGYIIAGVLLGPSISNIIPMQLNEDLEIFKVLGLGMIALMIGGELEIQKIKKLARSIFAITIVQFVGAFVAVFLGIYYLLGFPLVESLILGALAPATAPASPVAVIREYRASGNLTKTILGVVAVDDAACIVVFGIVIAIVGMMVQGQALTLATIFTPFQEVLLSTLLGVVTGVLIVFILNYFLKNRHRNQILAGLIALALLNSGVANALELSPLLVNMVTGFVIANLYENPAIISRFEDIEFPIYILFFTLTGATLNLGILMENWFPAVILIVTRGIGKVGGSFLGAWLCGAEEKVQKYLGFAMFSKAGVTIGLLMVVQDRFPEIAAVITALVLANVTIAELIGPLGTRYALVASGEAGMLDKKVEGD